VERHATEGMISNFGQTPTQLMREAHARRKSREQALRDKVQQGKAIRIWQQIEQLKAYYVELCEPANGGEPLDPVIYIRHVVFFFEAYSTFFKHKILYIGVRKNFGEFW
jgi:hypothetical protein